jgi:hypothetical protein
MDFWEFIGESYIHGIVNGEAWDEQQRDVMWLE